MLIGETEPDDTLIGETEPDDMLIGETEPDNGLIGEAEPDELGKSESGISIGELDPEEM